MLSVFLDIVVVFVLFCRLAINLPIIVILFQNTILPSFSCAHSYYCYYALTAMLSFCPTTRLLQAALPLRFTTRLYRAALPL